MVCPICSGALKVRDTKRRKLICTITELGVRNYQLRRLRCQNCGRLHTELPDCMKPYKHYEVEAIQAEIDGSQDNPSADESTLNRWRAEFLRQKNHIEGTLRSIWSQFLGSHYPLFKQDSLLESLRELESHWLSFVTKTLINRKFPIHTQFAFCP